MDTAPEFDQEMEKLESRLPKYGAKLMRWLRDPSARWLRLSAAILLILCGIVGFLPIFGFWMIPLGLALVAYDVQFLRPPMAKLVAYVNRKLPVR